MDDVSLRVVDAFPEPEITALQRDVFADDVPSTLLADVLVIEAATRVADANATPRAMFRVAAFRGETLVGWTQAYREGGNHLHMLNSGVTRVERRKGIYTRLVETVLAHAAAQGDVFVTSRHVAANNAVVIAKLRLGFQVSGFEYSEVYGPLVRLTYLVGDARRRLYASRASPIRAAE